MPVPRLPAAPCAGAGLPGSVLSMVRLGKQSRKTVAAVLEAAERHFGAGAPA